MNSTNFIDDLMALSVPEDVKLYYISQKIVINLGMSLISAKKFYRIYDDEFYERYKILID